MVLSTPLGNVTMKCPPGSEFVQNKCRCLKKHESKQTFSVLFYELIMSCTLNKITLKNSIYARLLFKTEVQRMYTYTYMYNAIMDFPVSTKLDYYNTQLKMSN